MNDYEIKQINSEREAISNEIDSFHKDFAKEISSYDIKTELRSNNNKKKKPLKIRISDFINRLLNVIN